MEEISLPNELLSQVASRITNALRQRLGMPYHALVYRVGEVSRNRIEPRLLRRALLELSNEPRPRSGRIQPGPWEPIHNIFLSPEVSRQEAGSAAGDVQAWTHDLATLLTPRSLVSLAEQLSLLLGFRNPTVNSGKATTVNLGGDATIEASQIFMTSGHQETPLRSWITHEPDWIHPDDPRLWYFLRSCEQVGARPLILARKIAAATFPLLKILQCQGTQFYATFLQQEVLGEARVLRERLGWSYVRSVSELQSLPVGTQLHQAVVRLSAQRETSQVRDAIREAVARGFTEHLTSEALLAWWQDSGLELSPGMVRTLERWTLWRKEEETARHTIPLL